MKTAQFEYTHMTEVDSSLAQAVYYNANDRTMAIEFITSIYDTGSAIYAEVPQTFYEGFVSLDSIGKTYNAFVKSTFKNISGGTVYNVDYVDYNSKTVQEPDPVYFVKGYVRHEGSFAAANRHEAINQFLDSLTDEGYPEEDLAVTEVTIVG